MSKDLLMNAGNRGFRGRSTTYFDRKSSDLPENIGNRRTFEELKIPPDDVGNQIERDFAHPLVHDGCGNSVDEEPAHLRSGILPQRGRPSAKRVVPRTTTPGMKLIPRARTDQSIEQGDASTIKLSSLQGEDYMAHLANEFSRLLRLRQGMRFSFSMKPCDEAVINEGNLTTALGEIETLLRDILDAAAITASVSLAEYCTPNHRFAVFFVAPKERDPVKNKDLISALRQIVELHGSKHPHNNVNVLLVLANAQHVIEEHLFKLGARKV